MKYRLPLMVTGALLCAILTQNSRISALTASDARWPEQSGTAQEQSGMLAVDYSNVSEGYFMAGAPAGCEHRLKLRVSGRGETLTYDLNAEGDYEVFPLQLGSGDYAVELYENVGGKKYAQAGTVYLSAALSREDAAFLYPNQYIWYERLSPIVEKAAELCEGKDEAGVYETVCSFMQSEFAYDFIRALTVSAGELPDPEGCFEKRMGICQDLSAVTVALLRIMGVPGRMIIGYADSGYHAWTMTQIGGEDRFFDPTAAVGGISAPKEYSMERYY